MRTVERAYGEDLDDIHMRGGLQALVEQLVYSSEDQRRLHAVVIQILLSQ